MPRRLRFTWSLLVIALGGSAPADEAKPTPISFVKDVAPIFAESCVACHNAKTPKGKYDMSSFAAIMKGGAKGPAVVAGKMDESLLVLMMHGAEEPAMPKDAELLDEAALAKIDAWVEQGAAFDGPDPAADIRQWAPKKAAKINYSLPTPITAIAFSPDGQSLAVAGYHEITFWNAADGAFRDRRPVESERVHALRYSPDGRRLVHAGGTPGQFGEVVLWDASTTQPVKQLLKTNDVVFSAAFSPDGKQVAAGAADRLFRIWDAETGAEQHQIENHADWIFAIAFSPDGKRLFTASRDKSAKIWDQSTKEPILTFPGHTDGVYAVAVSPDGKLAASAGADGHLRFWNADGDGAQTRDVGAHGGTVHALVWLPSGKLAITAGADRLIKAWNPADGAMVRQFEGHGDWVYSLAVTGDEARLASGAANGEVKVWDIATGKPIASFIALPPAPPKPQP